VSWSFQLQNINRSFERIAGWYTEFMIRTESCFRAFHERILQLEERQTWAGPSDEQVERVLRKILAERFASPGIPAPSSSTSEDEYFVANPKELAYPKPIPIDPATLLVEPDSVPSKAYAETIILLENGLRRYPQLEVNHFDQDDSKDIKMNMMDDMKPRYSNSV